MTEIQPSTPRAVAARALVDRLQARFAEALRGVVDVDGSLQAFRPISWLRDGGVHGGGVRVSAGSGTTFDRASLNVSGVHYDDVPSKRLSSATALSCIVHPAHPRAPSMHMHLSWTELRSGRGTWRVMADLNPALPHPVHTERVRAALAAAAGPHWHAGAAQGVRYFTIPSLGRTRGVVHYYLEGHSSGDFDADLALADRVGTAMIDTYAAVLRDVLPAPPPTDAEREAQLLYHSLYVLQVLTLDRGTTSGLLIHGDNDLGILASLPSRVSRDALAAWISAQPKPQDALLKGILDAIEPDGSVSDDAKRRAASVVRDHYARHPAALALQARGDSLPPTVANHRD